MTNIDEQHAQEFIASAIADDITALNFRSFDGKDESEIDQVFTLLIEEPDHNNNGTLSGKPQNDLANVLRGGGWIFEGYRGRCIKPNNPRKDKDGKTIKYESPRGVGKLQLFIPRVSWESGRKISAKAGLEAEYSKRMGAIVNPTDEDCGFWKWVEENPELLLIITEGTKKACSLISAGYPAIALNGVWGWGTNDRDMFGNVEKDERGKSLKTIHSDLEPFLDGRELVLAFDLDTNPETVKYVEAAKSAFCRVIEDDGIKTTQLTWRTGKGIDDYITAKGVKALDRIYTNRKEVKPKPQKEERVTCGDTLLEIGKTPTYFHTADKVAYADIWIDGNRHTYKVCSQAFRLWLSGEYFNREGKGISAQPLQDTLNTLEAIAIFQGETHEVHLRTAEHQGKIYLDLGTSDWKAVEIDVTGWRIVTAPPVKFWRPDSLLSLPYPVEGGSVNDLKDLLNVNDSSWVQLVTFLMFCYLPNQVYPVLVLSAIRGSGKTTAAEIIKSLIDPGKAPLIPLPSNTRDLAVAACRRWLMVYDNVSHISNDESDNLCKLATGFGFTARKLHTDDEETTIECTRPQIITAIDGVVAREDLGDRVLLATLGEITPDKRLSRSELNQKIYDSRPKIFGALLTALSQTLARLPHIQLPEAPRMKDYALFSVAAERALGLEDGTFLVAFEESRDRVREAVIESSPVGEAIVRLVGSTEVGESGWIIKGNESRASVWNGTASELLKKLEAHTDAATYSSRFFPKAANRLKAQLNRLAPDLRSMGIDVIERRLHGGTRSIHLEKVVKVSSPSSPDAEKDPEHKPSNKKDGDDTGDDTRSGDDTSVSIVTVPLNTKVITQQVLQPSGDDGDDGDDTFDSYSGNRQTKLKSESLESNPLSNVENHKFTNSSKISPPSIPTLKIGDRVTNLRSQTGMVKDFRTHTTPNGTRVPQAFVDYGNEERWSDLDVFQLVEVA